MEARISLKRALRPPGFLAVLWLVLLAPAREGRAASLSFDGPSSCPAPAAVVARIEAERGRPLAAEPEATFLAVVVEQADGALQLSVTTVSEGGPFAPERTLTAMDCAELVTALVRVVSLVLGPPAPRPPEARGAAEPAPESNPPPAPLSRPGPATDTVVMPTFAPPPAPDERPWFVAAAAEVDTAAFGTFAGGARLEGGHHFGRVLEARVGVGYLPPRHTPFDGPAADTALSLVLVSGSGLGCAAWTSPVLRVPLCAGVEVGELRARHDAESEVASESRVWVAARLDAKALFALNANLRVSLSTSLVFPWVRPAVLVDGALVHEIPALYPRLGAGLEWAP